MPQFLSAAQLAPLQQALLAYNAAQLSAIPGQFAREASGADAAGVSAVTTSDFQNTLSLARRDAGETRELADEVGRRAAELAARFGNEGAPSRTAARDVDEAELPVAPSEPLPGRMALGGVVKTASVDVAAPFPVPESALGADDAAGVIAPPTAHETTTPTIPASAGSGAAAYFVQLSPPHDDRLQGSSPPPEHASNPTPAVGPAKATRKGERHSLAARASQASAGPRQGVRKAGWQERGAETPTAPPETSAKKGLFSWFKSFGRSLDVPRDLTSLGWATN